MKHVVLAVGLLITGCGKASDATTKQTSITDAEMRLVSEQGGGIVKFANFYKSGGWSKTETKPSGEYHRSFEMYQLLHLVFGCHLVRCSDQPCKEAANRAEFEKLFKWQEVMEVVAMFEKQHAAFQFLLLTINKKRPLNCQHGTDCQNCYAFTYDILAYCK